MIYDGIYDLLCEVGLNYGVFGPLGTELVSTLLCMFIVLLPFIFVFAVLWRLLR